MQAWKQKAFSKIVFSISPARPWDSTTNVMESMARRCSGIYVFCLHHHQAQEKLDPLNMDQRTFYVVPTAVLNERFPNQKTISLQVLQQITVGVEYGSVGAAVRALAG